MTSWINKVRAWRSRRQRRSLERWALVRSKGKTRYVVRVVVLWSLAMIVFTATREYFNDGVQLDEMLVSAIVFPLVGILMALTTWWNMEGRYKTAQLDEDDIKRRLNG